MPSGRIKRRQREAVLDRLPAPEASDPVCPVCGRPIPAAQRDAHHLVPRSHGGRQTQDLHRVCHRQIHALFSEAQLARELSTVDALLAHPDMARFVAWVQGKPAGFMERTRRSAHRR